MSDAIDPIDTALLVVRHLEALGISNTVGGSDLLERALDEG